MKFTKHNLKIIYIFYRTKTSKNKKFNTYIKPNFTQQSRTKSKGDFSNFNFLSILAIRMQNQLEIYKLQANKKDINKNLNNKFTHKFK